MAKSITEVSVTNTFQTWLDKTNELVDLINSDVVTASPAGDTTVGNATLNGNFTATNLTANTLLRTDSISPKVGSTSILFNAPFNVTTSQTLVSTATSVAGPRIAFTDTVAAWQIGFENNVSKNFSISSVGSRGTLKFNSSGDLEVNGTVTALSFSGDGIIPIGGIIMWSGATTNIPVGWLLCDGTNGTPDLRNRFIVGAGGTYGVGAKGGADTVTLSTSQIPSHTHGFSGSTSTDGLHTHNLYVSDGYQGGGRLDQSGEGTPAWRSNFTEPAGSHSHTVTGSIASTGGGQAHENRPPYYALCFIMKV